MYLTLSTTNNSFEDYILSNYKLEYYTIYIMLLKKMLSNTEHHLNNIYEKSLKTFARNYGVYIKSVKKLLDDTELFYKKDGYYYSIQIENKLKKNENKCIENENKCIKNENKCIKNENILKHLKTNDFLPSQVVENTDTSLLLNTNNTNNTNNEEKKRINSSSTYLNSRELLIESENQNQKNVSSASLNYFSLKEKEFVDFKNSHKANSEIPYFSPAEVDMVRDTLATDEIPKFNEIYTKTNDLGRTAFYFWNTKYFNRTEKSVTTLLAMWREIAFDDWIIILKDRDLCRKYMQVTNFKMNPSTFLSGPKYYGRDWHKYLENQILMHPEIKNNWENSQIKKRKSNDEILQDLMNDYENTIKTIPEHGHDYWNYQLKLMQQKQTSEISN
jgi:hypothetical protein